MTSPDLHYTFATPTYFDEPDAERQFKVMVEDMAMWVSKDDLMYHIPVCYIYIYIFFLC